MRDTFSFRSLFFLVPLGLLVGEILLIRFAGNYLAVAIICSLIVLGALVWLVGKENRREYLLRAFVVGIRSSVFSANGIVMVLYLLIHIGWVGDNLRDVYLGENVASAWQITLINLAVLITPFVLLAVFSPAKADEKEVPRSILITGVSLFDNDRQAKSPLSKREGEILDKLRKDPTNWQNWNPIQQAMDQFPGLEAVHLITSNFTTHFLNLVEKDDTYKTCHLENLITGKRDGIRVVWHPTHEMYDVPDLHHFAKTKVVDPLKKVPRGNGKKGYRDDEIVFGITGGTAALTAALCLLSVKGRRAMVYTRQDDRKTVLTYEVDTLSLEELWSEIVARSLGD